MGEAIQDSTAWLLCQKKSKNNKKEQPLEHVGKKTSQVENSNKQIQRPFKLKVYEEQARVLLDTAET